MLQPVATLALAVLGFPSDRVPTHDVLAATASGSASHAVRAADLNGKDAAQIESIEKYFIPILTPYKDYTIANLGINHSYFEDMPYAGSDASKSKGCACAFASGLKFDSLSFHQPQEVTESADVPLCMYDAGTSTDVFNAIQSATGLKQCQFGEDGSKAPTSEGKALATTCLTPDYAGDLPRNTVYLLGDSHGIDLAMPLNLAVRNQFQLRQFFFPGVGLVPGSNAHLPGTKNGQQWWEVFNHVYDHLKSVLKEGDVVVLMEANRGMQLLEPTATEYKGPGCHTGNCDLDFIPTTVTETMEQRILGDVIEPSKAKLLVVGDWDANNGESANDPANTLARNMQRRDWMADIATRHPSAHYVSYYPLFCDGALPDSVHWTAQDEMVTWAEEAIQPLVDSGNRPTCDRYVPGIKPPIDAMNGGSQHSNEAGMMYMWSFVCDTFQTNGFFPAE